MRIGIFFPYDDKTKNRVKSLGAIYSITFRCWYVDYHADMYRLIKKNFSQIIIDRTPIANDETHQVAGFEGRDLPPTGVALPQSNSEVCNPKRSDASIVEADKGHKAEEEPLAKKLRLTLYDNLGKYWVFGLTYHQRVNRELLKVKGIYWNKSHKVYMAWRNKKVKEKAEAILEFPGFFPSDFYEKNAE